VGIYPNCYRLIPVAIACAVEDNLLCESFLVPVYNFCKMDFDIGKMDLIFEKTNLMLEKWT
jgi:hypothetical protein